MSFLNASATSGLGKVEVTPIRDFKGAAGLLGSLSDFPPSGTSPRPSPRPGERGRVFAAAGKFGSSPGPGR